MCLYCTWYVKGKAKKAVQESKRKTTRRKDKNERKTNKEWDAENDKKGRKKKTKKEKDKQKREKEKKIGKGVRAVLLIPGMLIAWVSTGGTHHDDDGHTQASVC